MDYRLMDPVGGPSKSFEGSQSSSLEEILDAAEARRATRRAAKARKWDQGASARAEARAATARPTGPLAGLKIIGQQFPKWWRDVDAEDDPFRFSNVAPFTGTLASMLAESLYPATWPLAVRTGVGALSNVAFSTPFYMADPETADPLRDAISGALFGAKKFLAGWVPYSIGADRTSDADEEELEGYAGGGSIAGTARRMAQAAMPQWVEGWASQAAPRGALSAVKPVGGQWLSNDRLTGLLENLPTRLATNEEQFRALQDFIPRRMGRYLRRDAGTGPATDPFAAAYAKGETPFPADFFEGINTWIPDPQRRGVEARQRQFGSPKSYFEDILDQSITADAAPVMLEKFRTRQDLGLPLTSDDQRWLEPLAQRAPETPIYGYGKLQVPEAIVRGVVEGLELSGIPPAKWRDMPLQKIVDTLVQNQKRGIDAKKVLEEKRTTNIRNFFKEKSQPLMEGSDYRITALDSETGFDDIAKAVSAATCQHGHCVGSVGHHEAGFETNVPMLDPGKDWAPVMTSADATTPYIEDILSGNSKVLIVTDKNGDVVATIEGTPDLDEGVGPFNLREITQIKGKDNGPLDPEGAAAVRQFLNKTGYPERLGDLENIDASVWGPKLLSRAEQETEEKTANDAVMNFLEANYPEQYSKVKQYEDYMTLPPSQFNAAKVPAFSPEYYEPIMFNPSGQEDLGFAFGRLVSSLKPGTYADWKPYWPQLIEHLQKNPLFQTE